MGACPQLDWGWGEKGFLANILTKGFRERLQDEEETKDNVDERELETERVSLKKRNSACRRLICKVYEVNPIICPKCGAEMRVMAVITDPREVRKILKHLMKIGRPPPGIENYSLAG